MKFARAAGVVFLVGTLIAGCTLRLDSASRLSNAPAPTTIPLAATAEPAVGINIEAPPQPVSLPPGFGITVYASGLNGPRMMALDAGGQLYVAERSAGRILRLPDRNSDGLADSLEVAAEGLNQPSSLDFSPEGDLYVGETTRVLRLSDTEGSGLFSQQTVVIDGLPSGGHSTRTVLFSPDGEILFVSVGSSCNVCIEEDARRAAILRYNPDGSGEALFASGLRNAVGLTFRPGTNELWATNNGRDWLGDDLPPETVNQVGQGDDFGWPRCQAGRIVDPDYGKTGDCEGVKSPAVEMQAHSAPLGLTFYSGSQFPEAYRGSLFVAFHGSWNRSTPTGYKIVHIPFQDGIPGPVEDFATGWLEGSGAWGRPVDVITGADGSLFVSDDASGRIYRIFYTGPS